MLYIPKVADCLKILNDKELKYFIVINFAEYFESLRYFKRKIALNHFIAFYNA